MDGTQTISFRDERGLVPREAETRAIETLDLTQGTLGEAPDEAALVAQTAETNVITSPRDVNNDAQTETMLVPRRTEIRTIATLETSQGGIGFAQTETLPLVSPATEALVVGELDSIPDRIEEAQAEADAQPHMPTPEELAALNERVKTSIAVFDRVWQEAITYIAHLQQGQPDLFQGGGFEHDASQDRDAPEQAPDEVETLGDVAHQPDLFAEDDATSATKPDILDGVIITPRKQAVIETPVTAIIIPPDRLSIRDQILAAWKSLVAKIMKSPPPEKLPAPVEAPIEPIVATLPAPEEQPVEATVPEAELAETPAPRDTEMSAYDIAALSDLAGETAAAQPAGFGPYAGLQRDTLATAPTDDRQDVLNMVGQKVGRMSGPIDPRDMSIGGAAPDASQLPTDPRTVSEILADRLAHRAAIAGASAPETTTAEHPLPPRTFRSAGDEVIPDMEGEATARAAATKNNGTRTFNSAGNEKIPDAVEEEGLVAKPHRLANQRDDLTRLILAGAGAVFLAVVALGVFRYNEIQQAIKESNAPVACEMQAAAKHVSTTCRTASSSASSASSSAASSASSMPQAARQLTLRSPLPSTVEAPKVAPAVKTTPAAATAQPAPVKRLPALTVSTRMQAANEIASHKRPLQRHAALTLINEANTIMANQPNGTLTATDAGILNDAAYVNAHGIGTEKNMCGALKLTALTANTGYAKRLDQYATRMRFNRATCNLQAGS